mmetsp:Transcript_9281/g.15146  ORF Transcript_9281/g.15146 Transcript_9281/m.15146 type:complete len:226 (-) Transcript_9281:457-1134(-)
MRRSVLSARPRATPCSSRSSTSASSSVMTTVPPASSPLRSWATSMPARSVPPYLPFPFLASSSESSSEPSSSSRSLCLRSAISRSSSWSICFCLLRRTQSAADPISCSPSASSPKRFPSSFSFSARFLRARAIRASISASSRCRPSSSFFFRMLSTAICSADCSSPFSSFSGLRPKAARMRFVSSMEQETSSPLRLTLALGIPKSKVSMELLFSSGSWRELFSVL